MFFKESIIQSRLYICAESTLIKGFLSFSIHNLNHSVPINLIKIINKNDKNKYKNIKK